MIRMAAHMITLAGGGLLGWIVRNFQLKRTQRIQPYRHQANDRLRPLPMNEELKDLFSDELQFSTFSDSTQLLISVHPEEIPETAKELLPSTSTRNFLARIEHELKVIRRDIGELRSVLEADEHGKLEANLEFVVDFSHCYSSSLLLMYTQQIQADRFAIVLEEIDRQTTQILYSLTKRLNRYAKQIYHAAMQSSVNVEELKRLITEYGMHRRKWDLGVNVRVICGCLRATLPKAHTAFVTRQLQRLKVAVRKQRQQTLKLAKIVRHLIDNASSEEKESWWSRMFTSTTQVNFDGVEKLVGDHMSLEESNTLMDWQFLKQPRKLIRQLSEEAEQKCCLVVDYNESQEVQQIWQLERGNTNHIPVVNSQDGESQDHQTQNDQSKQRITNHDPSQELNSSHGTSANASA